MFVLHLDQTSNGVSLSCTDGSPVSASPLAFDTVFSIAEYKFTKSTDMIFSLLKKGTNNHPWFLRPVLVQCSFDFMVISYEKKKGFDKISCHMIWWMARIAWWWHSFTDAQYSSLSGTRTCPEKCGRVSKKVSFSSKRFRSGSRRHFRWNRPHWMWNSKRFHKQTEGRNYRVGFTDVR